MNQKEYLSLTGYLLIVISTFLWIIPYAIVALGGEKILNDNEDFFVKAYEKTIPFLCLILFGVGAILLYACDAFPFGVER